MRPTGMRHASRSSSFIPMLFPLLQHFIPIVRVRSKPKPCAAELLRHDTKTVSVGVALGVAICRRNQLHARSGCKRAQSRHGCRRPTSAGAHVDRSISHAFDGSEAHRVNRGLGHANSASMAGPKPKQDFAAARCKAAPIWPSDFPSTYAAKVVGMCCPHAAVWPLT